MTDDANIFDDLFHGAALAAFLEQAHRDQGWPCPEATRQLAYRLYERALADRSAKRALSSSQDGAD